MKIKLFTIPNILTLANLVCGTVALIEILLYQNFVAAFILIIASAAFDFLDGMMARLLNQYSAIGRELDSLADMISFGLVPAMAMFTLFGCSEKLLSNPLWEAWGQYIPFIIVCFSALRLAKFNVDKEQESVFIGLPTPGNALFCLSVTLLASCGKITLYAEWVAAISVVMAIMLIVPLRMLALKFKSLGWAENKVRYIFLIAAAVTLAALREFALPVIIVIYIIVSIVDSLITRNK